MSSQPPPSLLAPGYRLDRYELLCPIAHGGMAEVWVARMAGKHGFERLVALKTILPALADDIQFQKMFLDEAHIAAGIEHPNVAQIFDLGEQHTVLYLAMELVDGESLIKLLRATEKKQLAMPLGVVLRVMADAAAGLHAAHELCDAGGQPLGVVHRDVSPHNILVSHKGIAKVIDFGVAKARDRRAADTNSGALKGKISYMAPEQAMGSAIDRRADVFALGAVLYHLLSGRLPFEAPNQLATLHRLASGTPPRPLPESVPSVVRDVVMRAMEHDLARRTANAAEVRRGLEAAMSELRLNNTAEDVAAYLREQVGERLESRRNSIQLAIAAASERARVSKMLAQEAEGSTSDPLPVGPGVHAPLSTSLPARVLDETLPGHATASTDDALTKPPNRRRAIALVVSLVGLAALLVVIGRVTAHKEVAAGAPPPVVSAPALAPSAVVEPTASVKATTTPSASASTTPSTHAVAGPIGVHKKTIKSEGATSPSVKRKPVIDDGI